MKKLAFETKLVHADRKINKPQHGAVHESTNNSVLFEFEDVQDLVDVFQGKKMGHVYSRSSSSSAVSLQNVLNELENGVVQLFLLRVWQQLVQPFCHCCKAAITSL